MPKVRFYLLLLLLLTAVLWVDNPILHFSWSAWVEPREVLLHLILLTAFVLMLKRYIGPAPAVMGGALFGFFPQHAWAWALGEQGARVWAMNLMLLGAGALGAVGFEKFYGFLKTQEALVRYLFIIAVAALALGLLLVTLQTNSVWQTETTLRRWRAKHAPTAENLTALADFLRSRDSYTKAQQYYRMHTQILQEHEEAVNPNVSALVEEVSGLYEKALKAEPRRLESYYDLAGYDLDLGRTKDALQTYKQALILDPKRQDTYFYLAQTYEGLGEPQQAIEMYNALLKQYPEDETVCIRVMDAYSKAIVQHPQDQIYQEKREEVLAQYEQLSKRKKYTADDFFNLGFLYEQVGGYEEAMRFYRKALELEPKHEKALANLANRYQQAGDVKTALALYERLAHFYPRSTFAYLNMGIIYNALGDTDRARYLYDKVIAIDPGNADAYFNRGYLNEAAGELREALNDYEKAVENNPRHSEAYYNMGNVYAGLEQYPEAIASYLKTVSLNPKHQNAFVNLSILSFKSHDFQGAIRYLEQAKLLGYTPPEAYLKTLEPYRSKK